MITRWHVNLLRHRHRKRGIQLTAGLVGVTLLSQPVAAHGIAGGLEYTRGEAVFLGLTVAFMWGLIPVLSKRGYERGGSPMVAASVIVVSGLVIFWTALAVVNGPTRAIPRLTPLALYAFLAGGFFGTAIGRIAMFVSIDRVGASITSGVIATNPAPAFVLGYLFLAESVTPLRLLGIAVIIVGLVALSLSKGGDIRAWQPRHLVFALIAALVFGGGHVLRRFGMTLRANPLAVATPLEAAAINEVAATVGILAFAFGYRGAHRQLTTTPRGAYQYFVAAGIVGAIGLYTEFELLIHEKAAVVTALVATQVLFATAFTYLFLGDIERITRGMIAGVVIVIAGLVLLGL